MRDFWDRLSVLQKLGICAALVIGVPSLVAGMVAGAKDSSGHKDAAAPASSARSASSSRPASTAAPGAAPTFTYPGGPQCAITYRSRGDGSMSWTATTTVAGELITHATDSSATVYRHDAQVKAGVTSFSAPVPLTKITDIGGNLRGAGTSYGCSVRPAR